MFSVIFLCKIKVISRYLAFAVVRLILTNRVKYSVTANDRSDHVTDIDASDGR